MAEFIDVETFEERVELDTVPDSYADYREAEGIPVHTGLAVDDVRSLETGPWERTGQSGAFINLYGMEGIVDLQVHDLAANEGTTRQHHFFEEIVYVVSGNGATVIEGAAEEVTFEWESGSLFVIPQNTPYRHVNLGDAPCRVLAQTILPHLCSLVTDRDSLFEPERNGWADRDEEFYAGGGTLREGSTFPVVWEANFIPDVGAFENLETWELRGAGGKSVRFPLSETSMWSHISEFPVGTYKKAHRHRPGASVSVLSGEGYSLMWREGWEELVEIPWGPGSIFTPPARWYHQHFNTGERPARYFAIHAPDFPLFNENEMFHPHIPENYIEYANEDPAIRAHFESELAEVGLDSQMPEACYSDPDYVFE